MYKVIIENKVRKKIRRFPKHLVRRIHRVMSALRSNPRPPSSEKLSGSEAW